MAYSSILGADTAPTNPSGRDADLLGPSDNSDSGSDTIGTNEAHEDSDSVGTGSRGAVAGADAREGGDIMPDRVVNLRDGGEVTNLGEGNGFPEADPDGMEMTDLDDDDISASTDEDIDAGKR
jgi:hypothetical protein